MKKKILIPYATYGSGHKSIANYVKDYFESTGKYECLTVDLLDYSLPLLGKFTRFSSNNLMSKFPLIWSLLYFGFDNRLSTYITSNMSIKMFDSKKLRQKVIDFNPDITISTHFWGTDIINKFNKKGLIDSKIISVVTDYVAHDVWLKSIKNIDAIIVSSFDERLKLLMKGFKNNQIYTTGIPIPPQLTYNLNKNQLKNKYKINNKMKTVLFFVGGGDGALFNLIYFKELLKNNYNCNILFVAGRSNKAYSKAKEYVRRYNCNNVRVFGFVTNVNELYYISDFVVTKPGGVQVTECLLFECPMLLIKSNGGQEIGNRRFLIKNGYAKHAYNKYTFNKNFIELLINDKLRNKMKKNISKIEQNKSMEKLYKIVEKL